MIYEKYDIITFDDDDKVVVLETLLYNGIGYLYVDKVDKEEKNTLNKFHILRINEDGYLQKETNTDVLMEILPLFNTKIKLTEE